MDPQRMSPVSAAKNFAQTITFKGSDTNYSVQIVAQDVTINCNTGSHNHGSSKVKLTNVVDYNWEQKYYTGHLLAVHVTGKYFAYGIKARNPTGKGGGMVRVATHDSSMRALIKEMSGQVQDIAFAHNYNTVILACVDEEGSLFVYNIEEKTDNLICTLLLHVVQTETPMNTPSLPRVVWCPYLPEEDEAEDDASKLLVLTHGNKAQLMNVAIINNKNGAGPLPISELTDGYLEINEHAQPIMDAAFSPDGTAVATASIDGYVKFFQIYMHEGTKPRCLHEWQPHDGKPLSCLSFLDNHNIYGADEQFWKFAITGCNNNTELKIWSCESWTCLQTLNFVSNPSLPSHEIFLKVRLDLSAGYLLLSDINNRVLYILEMHKDSNGSNAFARSISEFLLPASVLSFAILEASLRKFRCSNSTEDLYPCEENDDYEDGQNIVATVIRMYVIQPKRLQECRIVFQPDSFNKLTSVPSPLTSKNLIFPEGLSEIANDTRIDSVEVNQEISSTTSDTVVNPLSQLTSMLQNEMPKHYNELQNLLIQPTQPLNLMTPDAFSSPAKNDGSERNSSSQNSPTLIQMNSSPLPDQLGKESSAIENNILNFQRTQKENFASGGSSPSREVQEILALNNTTYNTHEYYEDNKVTEEDVEVLTKKTDVFDQSDTYQTNTAVMYSEPSNLNADGWPSIPILKAKDVVKTEECRLSMQECNLNSTDPLAEPMMSMNHKDNSSVVNNRSLQQWILTLMSMVREQNSQLVELQTEIKTLKLSQEKCNVPEDLENVIAKQLDLALARSHAQQIKLFENWASARMSKDRELHEALILNLSLAVSKQVHDKLQTAVNFEMTQTVLPHVIKTFENLKTLLLEDFSGKMARSDQMLKDNLNKFISSKAVVDSISASVANVVRPNMEKCYKEVISTTLLPSWDRVCNNMFQQLNETFSAGTREYTQSLENHLERTQKRSMDKGREMVSQMQGLCDTMRGSADKLGNTLPNDMQKLFVTSFGSMQEKLLNSMNEMIREEVSAAFRSHASVLEDSVINAVRSRAVTPSPHDTQVQLVQIQQLLSQGHVNAAFQQALSAADLSLVVYICEKLNPQKLFSQSPCPIQPHVILSLIQQLSADMNNQTELKIQYLEEAVMNLDPSNPVTKEHITTVLRELLRQLTAFIAGNPTNKNTRQIKMLQMAAHGLLIPK